MTGSIILKAKPTSVLEASYNAQMIAFAPVVFQVARSLRDLGVLACLANYGKKGTTSAQLAEELDQTLYGIDVLLEIGEKIGMVELRDDDTYALLPTGRFILSDEMTRVNMDFTHDVCYQGLYYLDEAIETGKPAGLKVFGEWDTVYEALSSLPKQAQKSWFDFDHFYSDSAFPAALKYVFRDKPATLLDIGGNTGKWAMKCCQFDPDVTVSMLDLPGQLEMAAKNIEEAGLSDRINRYPMNLLDHSVPFPVGAEALWMSQFLVCFSEEDVVELLKRSAAVMQPESRLFILDTFFDQQRNEVGEFCLQASSLYFTCMANGNSRMYSLKTMKACLEKAGLVIEEQFEDCGVSHLLLKCSLA